MGKRGLVMAREILVYIGVEELAELISRSIEGKFMVDMKFGTGGTALFYQEGGEVPQAIIELDRMRNAHIAAWEGER